MIIGVIPFGSYEFHGPHLPPTTDTLLADYFAQSLAREQDSETWQVVVAPTVSFGVSPEHLWHNSTCSVSASTIRSLTLDLCDSMYRAAGVSRFVFLNCHGGNRPALEQVCDEVRWTLPGKLAILVNPVSLVGATFTRGQIPEVHAGLLETSLLLAIAPALVDIDALGKIDTQKKDGAEIRKRIGRRGLYWPWSSQDPSIAVNGVIGEPRGSSADLGREIAYAATEALREIVSELANELC